MDTLTFYPSSVAESGAGAAWSNPHNTIGVPDGSNASASITGEGVTKLLQFNTFSVCIPHGKTIKEVRFVPHPMPSPLTFNPSEYQMVHAGGTFDTSLVNEYFRVEDVDSGFPTVEQIMDPA